MKNCEVRTGVIYQWFRLKCTFRNKTSYIIMQKKVMYLFLIRGKISGVRWRMEEFGNQC